MAKALSLSLYRRVLRVVEPAISLAVRALLRREGRRALERLGREPVERPKGSLIWMHGASVGETLSLVPLIAALRTRNPEATILVTSLTPTSSRMLAKRLPHGVLHRYAPLDLPGCVERFQCAWKPDLLILVESEIWPILVSHSHERGIPTALIGARVSRRSMRNWSWAAGAARAIFGSFSLVLARDTHSAKRLIWLGARPEVVQISPSLKSATDPLPADVEVLQSIQSLLRDRPVWLAASTHRDDEEMALLAHEVVRKTMPRALLLLVPRHPERGKRIEKSVRSRGMRCSRRTAGTEPGDDEAVYVADTLGELGVWYRISEVAFMGGSFGGIGGHNPFEAIALDAAILHGPDVFNFEEIYRALDSGGGAFPVSSGDELGNMVLSLLGDPSQGLNSVRKAALRATEIASTAPDAAEHIASRLIPFLPRARPCHKSVPANALQSGRLADSPFP